MFVPFLDLKAQLENIRGEITAALEGVLADCAFVSGPAVSAFEESFAEFCGVRYAVGLGSGTSALWASLLALDVGPGDEVITVPNTFIATAEAVSKTGARPVFVDVRPDTACMDPELLESVITEKTKAIIPVHLYGRPADMDPIMEIARAYRLHVIEDACQAHGALYKGKRAGSIADAGCFSFYPGKNLGAYGEAGAVVTNDEALYRKIRLFRDHGQPEKYRHEMIGWNDRMDGFQGAVLRTKLKYLPLWNEARRSHAEAYAGLLSDCPGIDLPVESPLCRHVYHIFAVRTEFRDDLLRDLQAKGVQCGIHYPVPIHLQKAYRFLNLPRGSYPVAESWADTTLSLPMYPELKEEQIRHTAEAIMDFPAERGKPMSAARGKASRV